MATGIAPASYSSSGVTPPSSRSWNASSTLLTGTPSMRVVRTLWCCSAMLVRLQRGWGEAGGGHGERVKARGAKQTMCFVAWDEPQPQDELTWLTQTYQPSAAPSLLPR